MTTTKATLDNHLKLDNKAMKNVSDKLNDLLSDYHIFYQNVRGFHWNVKGENFFDLHEKFEELYTRLYENIDELAERIVTIGFNPLHSYSDYLKNTIHKEITDVSSGSECVKHVVDGLGILAQSHRKAAKAAGDADDIATEDLLTNFVGDLEKRMWMFTKFAE
ncbi:DNA starvation/stationary phase protection protein [Algoriphagus halophytocola]|uniref:DNA starvation/stationary phase protection protein n=1 Tax=Algoriphagus halophytocola TaxID=2991499 RepID=A0ABY6MKN7_9BACT|nr:MULTISPECIES: DNA starvation/stationary phase protection protein [unclassified Algoriphagus]UZD23665.1 DNA starvation/stationary phase protection protein [Algoriphagus sp. TR-M5]WBL44958.1 DNA starvation/stationary phase protection protein [Algoriphagus sp. TR-M9]